MASLSKLPRRSCDLLILSASLMCFTSIAYSQNDFVLDDKLFNEWVFGTTRGIDEESEIARAIQIVDRACQLSNAQKKELTVAGKRDYSRFQKEVDELRAQYVGKSYSTNNRGKLCENVEPLTEKYESGLLGDSSFFTATLHKTLDNKQQQRYDTIQAELWHTYDVRALVTIYQENHSLRSPQRLGLLNLLLKRTQIEKKSRQADWYALLEQAARINDAEFEPFLARPEIQAFRDAIREARTREMSFLPHDASDE